MSDALDAQSVFGAIESAYAMERREGFLCMDAMRASATFAAARYIAETGDSDIIYRCPAWLVAELYGWVKECQGTWAHLVFSNLGEADHTGIIRSVGAKLPPRDVFGPRLELRTRSLQYPCGSFSTVYTFYEDPLKKEEVRHGICRGVAVGTSVT